ncbi:MAG: hypothetical protein Q7S59_02925 [Sulfurimonas sp.]|nr:hypothetical protein [Sulfurimonas sp.]
MSLIHWYESDFMPHAHKNMIQNFTVGFVSGAVVSGIKNMAETQLDESQKLRDGFKTAVQSGIAASMIADANHKMMHNNHVGALISFGIGALGVYAIQKLAQKTKKEEVKENA